jgi:apolipoprotein N-acyltransferase
MTFASALSLWRGFLRFLSGARFAASFGFGLLAALAFPPFQCDSVLWLSFPALVLLLRGGTQEAGLRHRLGFCPWPSEREFSLDRGRAVCRY